MDQISDIDLSALLCSKVCHDVISPVGAIINGLEVLDEEKDEDMRQFAMDLIRKSANAASAKLQFCRIAFGAAGTAGAEIDLRDAEQLVQSYLAQSKITLSWSAPLVNMNKNKVKLLMNLVLQSVQSIPRGGKLHVEIVENNGTTFTLTTQADVVRLPQELEKILSGSGEIQPGSADAILPYFTLRLAESVEMKLQLSQTEGQVILKAESLTKA